MLVPIGKPSTISVDGGMSFQGAIDCSANPDYPAADKGQIYRVSVAGKIGGASGPNVEVGDTLLCLQDATASGNHATVGAYWNISQTNIDGAVTGPASSTNSDFVQFNGTTGKIIKDGGLSLDTDSTMSANSDSKIPSQKAVKARITSYAQPFHPILTSFSGLSPATANTFPYFTGGTGISVQGITNDDAALFPRTQYYCPTAFAVKGYVDTSVAGVDGDVTALTGVVADIGPAHCVQRVLSNTVLTTSGTFLLADDTAYFIYLGLTTAALTPKYIEFYMTTAGSGSQNAEVGLFSTPAAPNKSDQTLTRLVANSTVDDLTATLTVKRNTSAMATAIPAGTHLWAGIRTNLSVTQPTCIGMSMDMLQGNVLTTATAGDLTASSTFAGVIPSISAVNVAPAIRATLD